MATPLKTILSSIFLNIIGVLGFLLSPLIVGNFVDGYDLSEAEAGYIIAFLMLGIMLSSIMMFVIGVRLNQKLIRALALLVGALGCFMIGLSKDYHLLIALATITGFAGGVLSSANFALLSRTAKAGRNFSILLFLMTSIGAISLIGITQISSALGAEFIFFTFAIIHFLALPLVHFIEPVLKTADSKPVSLAEKGEVRSSKHLPWLCLLMFFLTYVAIGAFWPYAERLGIAAGLSSEHVGGVLGGGLILTLLGCVVASWLVESKGGNRPLAVGLIVLALILILLGTYAKPYAYIICVLIFYFLWNMIDIFELSVLSSLVQEGRYAALAAAFQACGAMMGPAIAASIIASGWGLHSVMYFSCLSICIALILLLSLTFKINCENSGSLNSSPKL